MIRISRPCYDKMHRRPGWAGGGMRFAKVHRCDDGRLRDSKRGDIYAGRWWRFRCNRCDTCDVLVLPYVIRYVDWRWWTSAIDDDRTVFRALLVIVVAFYFLNALADVPGGFGDWFHLAAATCASPMVLKLGWKFSR